MDSLQPLRDALAAGPTPGPWFVDEDPRPGMSWNRSIDTDAGHGHTVCFMTHSDGKFPKRDKATAAFIAACDPDTIRALLARVDAAIPPGMVLVPVEPTLEMLRAVDDEADNKFVARGRAYSAWKSMIAAAPSAPGAPTVQPQAEAVMLNEDEIVKAALSSRELQGRISLTYESGPYDISRPTLVAQTFAEAIQLAFAKKNGFTVKEA